MFHLHNNNRPDGNSINCIKFTYKQLQDVTGDFSESLKLGEGGFGPVFKGNLLYTTVAIKKLRKVSVAQFLTQVVLVFCVEG